MLLTVGLRDAGVERRAIEDEEEVEIAVGKEGVVRARRGDSLELHLQRPRPPSASRHAFGRCQGRTNVPGLPWGQLIPVCTPRWKHAVDRNDGTLGDGGRRVAVRRDRQSGG